MKIRTIASLTGAAVVFCQTALGQGAIIRNSATTNAEAALIAWITATVGGPTNGISAATATNIAEYQAQIATNTLQAVQWATNIGAGGTWGNFSVGALPNSGTLWFYSSNGLRFIITASNTIAQFTVPIYAPDFIDANGGGITNLQADKIAAGQVAYARLPVGTVATPGIVKADGVTTSIAVDGTLTATSGAATATNAVGTIQTNSVSLNTATTNLNFVAGQNLQFDGTSTSGGNVSLKVGVTGTFTNNTTGNAATATKSTYVSDISTNAVPASGVTNLGTSGKSAYVANIATNQMPASGITNLSTAGQAYAVVSISTNVLSSSQVTTGLGFNPATNGAGIIEASASNFFGGPVYITGTTQYVSAPTKFTQPVYWTGASNWMTYDLKVGGDLYIGNATHLNNTTNYFDASTNTFWSIYAQRLYGPVTGNLNGNADTATKATYASDVSSNQLPAQAITNAFTTLTNNAAGTNTIAYYDNGKRLYFITGGSGNGVLHDTWPPSYSGVVVGDITASGTPTTTKFIGYDGANLAWKTIAADTAAYVQDISTNELPASGVTNLSTAGKAAFVGSIVTNQAPYGLITNAPWALSTELVDSTNKAKLTGILGLTSLSTSNAANYPTLAGANVFTGSNHMTGDLGLDGGLYPTTLAFLGDQVVTQAFSVSNNTFATGIHLATNGTVSAMAFDGPLTGNVTGTADLSKFVKDISSNQIPVVGITNLGTAGKAAFVASISTNEIPASSVTNLGTAGKAAYVASIATNEIPASGITNLGTAGKSAYVGSISTNEIPVSGVTNLGTAGKAAYVGSIATNAAPYTLITNSPWASNGMALFTATTISAATITNTSAAANSVIVTDGQHAYSYLSQGTGALTNNNAGAFGWYNGFYSSATVLGTAFPAALTNTDTRNLTLAGTMTHSNHVYLDAAHFLYPSNLTAARLLTFTAAGGVTNAGASGAVPIDADGTATTFAQVNALAPSALLTNNHSAAVTFSNAVTVDAAHVLTATSPALATPSVNGGYLTNVTLYGNAYATNYTFTDTGGWHNTNTVAANAGTTIAKGLVTAQNVNYYTNLATMAPDFSQGYTLITTNAAFTLLAPINVVATADETTVWQVTNSTAAAVAITPFAGIPAGAAQGTWYVTNLTAITVHHYGTIYTNAIARPIW